MTQKPLVLTMGEPAGIGGEITIQAWRAREEHALPLFYAIDNVERLKAIDPDLPIQEIQNPSEAISVFPDALPVYPIDLAEEPILGTLNPKNGAAVLESIKRAVDFCMTGESKGMVTNPIHKAALYNVGFDYPGHTEFIAALCGKNETPAMMLTAKDLRVVPLTIHIPIKKVSSTVTPTMLSTQIRIVNESLKRDYKIASPRIAVCGLNPHAGEGGKIGTEEQEFIEPTLRDLKAEGIDVRGPLPADTMFHEQARKNYDIAIGMYHDQVLVPVKTIDFYGGVNVTLGLSVVRTSPDHGTALDIAGRGVARAESLINAIKMAAQIAKNRAS